MTTETLHALASELDAAFSGEIIIMTRSERIIELSGGQWVGIQKTDDGPVVLFRDPVTGSTCGVSEDSLTVSAAQARMTEKRVLFGAVNR